MKTYTSPASFIPSMYEGLRAISVYGQEKLVLS